MHPHALQILQAGAGQHASQLQQVCSASVSVQLAQAPLEKGSDGGSKSQFVPPVGSSFFTCHFMVREQQRERLPVSLRLLCRVLCGQMHYTEGQVDGSASANAKQVGQAVCRPCPNLDRTQLRHDAKPNLGKSHDLMQMNAVGRKMLTSQVGKHAVLANPLAEGPREFIVLTEMQAECFPPSHRAKIPVAARSTPSTWWRCLCPRRRALEVRALGGHVAAT